MADVFLKNETPYEIHFAHRPLLGLVVVAFGGVFGWVGVTQMGGFSGWVFTAVGLVAMAVGVGVLLWRHELYLDLVTEHYWRRKGFVFLTRRTEGTFKDIRGIAIEQEERRRSSQHGSSKYIVWVVKLPFVTGKPVSVYESASETKGYARAEALAKKLRRPLMDRTTTPGRTTAWDELDTSLADRLSEESRGSEPPQPVGGPPEGSGIDYDPTPSRCTIRLPAFGFNLVSGSLCVFGLMFGGSGAFFLVLLLTGAPVEQNPEGSGWVIAPLFMLIGLGVVLVGVLVALAREVVREDAGALVIAWAGLGRDWGRKRIEKHEVEGIDIRRAAETRRSQRQRGQQVVVRSDRHVARLGRHLTDEQRQWLKDALTAIVYQG